MKKDWWALGVIGGFLLFLTGFTWLKWGDLLIDTGRELYVPALLASGKLLYRDVFYLYGPVAPYLNALFYILFGVKVTSLVLGGFLSLVAATLLIYRLCRVFLDEVFAAFTVLFFLAVFAFGRYVYLGNYTFILPYSFPATYGFVLCLSGLYLFWLYLSRGRRLYEFGIGFCVLLTLLTRVDMGVFLLLAVLPGRLLLAVRRGEAGWRNYTGMVLTYLVIPVALAAMVSAGFYLAGGATIAQSNLLDILKANTQVGKKFTGYVSGLDNPGRHLTAMAKSAMYYLLIILVLLAGSLCVLFLRKQNGRPYRRAVALLICGLYLAAAPPLVYRLLDSIHRIRYWPLPVFCLAAAVIALIKAFRARGEELKPQIFLWALSLFALATMARMILNVWPGHYGFYLAVTGMMVSLILLFRIIPGWLPWPGAGSWVRWGLLITFTGLAVFYVRDSMAYYRTSTLEVSSPRGKLFFVVDQRNKALKGLIDYMARRTPKGSTLTVMPEGLTINYLSGRDNPLYYYSFLPVDLDRKSVLAAVIADLEQKRPDYIAAVSRNTAEYGAYKFGVDYGQEITEYISSRYSVLGTFGREATLLARKPAAH